jgi:hypothetical protein
MTAPDFLTLDLTIDDKPLKEVIGSLHHPDWRIVVCLLIPCA